MTDTDTWVWLRHPETEGVQHVPPSALETWLRLGWEPTEAPSEPNLALVEYQPPVRPVAPKKKTRSEVAKQTEPTEPEIDEKEMD